MKAKYVVMAIVLVAVLLLAACSKEEPTPEADSTTPAPVETQESGAPETARSVKGADIRIEYTPGGIIIASEDTEALDKFESLLRQVAPGRTPLGTKNFTVYFLKYCKADVARQLISDILGGASSDIGGGSLVGDELSRVGWESLVLCFANPAAMASGAPAGSVCSERPRGLKPAARLVARLMNHGTRLRLPNVHPGVNRVGTS